MQTQENILKNKDFLNQLRPQWEAFILDLQDKIVEASESVEPKGKKFKRIEWERDDKKGRGIARVIEDGDTFEKAGCLVTIMRIPMHKGIYS